MPLSMRAETVHLNSCALRQDSCGPVPGAWAAMALTLSFVPGSHPGPPNAPEQGLV